MQLHLLLTDDIKATMPNDVKIIEDYGQLLVRFEDIKDRFGLHCIVEAEQQVIVDWLKPFDGFVKGSGTPIFESFTIAHVADGEDD